MKNPERDKYKTTRLQKSTKNANVLVLAKNKYVVRTYIY